MDGFDGAGHALAARQGQGDVIGAHGLGDVLSLGVWASRRIEPNGIDETGPPLLSPRQRLCFGNGPGALALQRHVRSSITQHHQSGRHAPLACFDRRLQCEFERTGKRRSTASWHGLQFSFGTHQRAGGGELKLCTFIPEADHADVISPGIGVFEQQLHGALGFCESLERCRARGIDAKDDATLASFGKTLNVKILTSNLHTLDPLWPWGCGG